MAKKNDNDIEVVIIDEPEEMPYNFSYGNSRDKTKLIKRIEKSIRASLEYRDYIAFLRENVGMDACAFFNNISKETSKSIRIEIHHEPLTLYDITAIVLKKYEDNGLPLNSMRISKEVMKNHYNNQVGLIPLSKTLHEVVHSPSDKLVIPAFMIYGDYTSFCKEYADYIEAPQLAKIERLIQRTKELKKDSYEVLEKKYTYLQVDGFTMPAKIESEEIDDLLNKKKEVA